MARRWTSVVLLLAGLAPAVTACGGGDAGTTARLAAWNVPPPYLPPPNPSARPDGAPARRVDALGTATRETRAADGAAPGAPTDAEIRAELRQAYGGPSGLNLDQASIDGAGLAIAPPSAPARLVALIRGANEVARKPYVYGGGHGRNPNEVWEDSAYDCSGSVSYALATAGYIDGPMDSSSLARWGKPGPGRWVTIYANGGHAFMVVAGLRFDTSGRQVTGTRWQSADARSYAGFTVRHPPGL
jgi:cell wall-associated NlpC family hydrolase